jgi:surface antigen
MKTIFKKSFLLFIITIFLLGTFLITVTPFLYADETSEINCTDYAYEKRPDLERGLGYAKYWADGARSRGFLVDNIPQAGDIAVFQPGDHGADKSDKWCLGGCGHVAYVETINSDGTFNISERNYPIGTYYHERNSLKVLPNDRFIHKKEGGSKLEIDLESTQTADQSATPTEKNFFGTIGDWFKNLWANVIDIFTVEATEPSTTKSATIVAGQESQPEIQGSVTTETVVTIPPPLKPSLTSPYNWYQSLGGAPTLIWKGDENSVSYYIIVNSSNTGDIKSGWINSTSWKPNLPNENYIYSWKVKAKNSKGVESEWSESRNFSVASTTLKFEGDISFSPPSPSSADQIKIFASTTGWGGVGVTLRVSVNTALDGSSNGEWRILKELGVPKFNEVDAPEWHTNGWSNGTYRIRVEAKGPDDPNWRSPAVIEATYTLTGKENSVLGTNSFETSNFENKIDSNSISMTKNLVIYKSYDDQNDKNIFVIMNIDGTNKNIIYLDNFLVDYGKINEYSKLKYNLKDANSPFLSSDGRFILCNEGGKWLTHMLDIKENSLKTFEYIDENNELNSGSIRHDPCFSPNTDIIALSGIHTKYTDFNVQLCTFLKDEIENANLKVLTDLSSWVGDPRFSPDGSKIIFSSGNDEIIIINSDGSNIFNFTDKFGYKGSHPAFSPDGSKIVFMYSDSNHQPYSIATVNLDGTDFKEIYRHSLGRCESPSFSSDSARIIFCAPSGDPTGHYRDIFSIDLQGNGLVNLTNSDKIDDCEPECVY